LHIITGWSPNPVGVGHFVDHKSQGGSPLYWLSDLSLHIKPRSGSPLCGLSDCRCTALDRLAVVSHTAARRFVD